MCHPMWYKLGVRSSGRLKKIKLRFSRVQTLNMGRTGLELSTIDNENLSHWPWKVNFSSLIFPREQLLYIWQGWTREKFIKLGQNEGSMLENRAGPPSDPMPYVKSPLLYHNWQRTQEFEVWSWNPKDPHSHVTKPQPPWDSPTNINTLCI